MRYILRQAAFTIGCVLILYSIALGTTFLVAPNPPAIGTIDTEAAGDTLFMTGPKYVFLGRDLLNVPGKKVLLVGASNTAIGFRQNLMQRLVPCVRVSNISIGGSNISQVRQAIDLVQEVQDPANRRSTTFVIGVWYGMFVDTESHWAGNDRHHGDTDLDIERYRYGFFRRTASGPVEVLPPQWLPTGFVLIRPYLLLEKLARDLTAGLRQTLFVRPPELTDDDREKLFMTDKQKSEAFAYWYQSMGGKSEISEAQVALLQDTIERLLQAGEKVVLVDLPIPDWHRTGSPYEPGYVRMVRQVMFHHFADRPGFVSLPMDDLGQDANYSDEVHPKPHVAKLWAARLADVLDAFVCRRTAALTAEGGVQHGGAITSKEVTTP